MDHLRQAFQGGGDQIDLDDIDYLVEFGVYRAVFVIVQRQGETAFFEEPAAIDQFRSDLQRFQKLQHHLFLGQKEQRVVHQHFQFQIDEATVFTEDILDAEAGQGVDDDVGGCPGGIGDLGRLQTGGAKQQFVGDQLFAAVENRLSTEKIVVRFHSVPLARG